jgi:hypothetical protein
MFFPNTKIFLNRVVCSEIAIPFELSLVKKTRT